jgi:hypothetical protein
MLAAAGNIKATIARAFSAQAVIGKRPDCGHQLPELSSRPVREVQMKSEAVASRAVQALVAFAVIASLGTFAVLSKGGQCGEYSRENSVKTRAWSLNEWDSCQYFDGDVWRSVHTKQPMDRLRWSSR